MSKSPYKGAAASGSNQSTSPRKVPLKGLFADGIWHCNCSPRLPAARFQVRKEGANKGRWFYTCQKPKGEDCGFFLWEDKAVGREVKVILNNSHSELNVTPTTPETPSKRRSPEKRKFEEDRNEISRESGSNLAVQDDDEFGSFPLTAEDVKLIEDAASKQPETPRKAIKTGIYDTPQSLRRQDNVSLSALPTPITGRKESHDVFTTPSTKRKANLFESDGGNEPLGLQTPSKTPASRFNRSFDTITSNASDSNDHRELSISSKYDITDDVLDLLKDQVIDDQVISNLRSLLDKHALRVSGIARGRDITRLALQNKDAKIAELQEKINTLEHEKEIDKTVIRHFKNDMASSINNRGGGRGGKKRS